MIRGIIHWMKRLNEALPGLIGGILLWGLLIQLTGVWFVSDKLRYSAGTWIGTACAVGMGIHVAMVIEESVRYEGTRTKLMSVKSVIRYLVVVAVFAVMMYFRLGSLIPAFLSILGLKVSAYAQPFLHKIILKLTKSEGKEEVKL